MNAHWLICIDDTDNEESVGTGKLARWLGANLAERHLIGAEFSVTRHQLLVHPDIPYTSHNSSACIKASSRCESEALLDAARDFLKQHWHEGANPGLCVVRADRVCAALVELAEAAQQEVLKLDEFDDAIRDMRLAIWATGETGQGRIGACAGAALRSTEDDGRFIGLRGIRDLTGCKSVRDICSLSGVDEVRLEGGGRLGDDVEIETRDWVRPSLISGRAVFLVREEAGQLVPANKRSKDD